MKKPLLVLAFAAMYVGACAQSSVAYFVEGSTFRTQLNPAFAPHKGYLNIPVLGGVQVDINGNIPFGALLFDNDGKLSAFTENGVSIDEVLSKVSARNDLSVGSRINIFGIGSYTRNARNFWSVDLAMNLAGEVNAPRELFTFLKAGQATDIRDVHVSMQSYADLSFAYSLRLCPGLYFGARIRAIAGMLGTSADIERLDISIGSDRWYADMTGSIEMNGIDGDLQTGDRISLDEVTDYIDVASMLKPSGYGGATISASRSSRARPRHDALPPPSTSAPTSSFSTACSASACSTTPRYTATSRTTRSSDRSTRTRWTGSA